jgi:hypothetical protein
VQALNPPIPTWISEILESIEKLQQGINNLFLIFKPRRVATKIQRPCDAASRSFGTGDGRFVGESSCEWEGHIMRPSLFLQADPIVFLSFLPVMTNVTDRWSYTVVHVLRACLDDRFLVNTFGRTSGGHPHITEREGKPGLTWKLKWPSKRGLIS